MDKHNRRDASNGDMNTVLITGNTYPVKDALRAMGGRWDANAKGWRVPADRAPEAHKLVRGGSRPTQARTYRNCKVCHGPIRDCAHQQAMGGMCGSCAYDAI